MSQVEVLTIGPNHDLTANTVYALPARNCNMFVNSTTANIMMTMTNTTTGGVTLTLTNGQAVVAGGFISTTVSNITVMLKAN